MKWETVRLGDIATCIQPGPFGSQLHNSDYSESGTPLIMPKDMINGHISHSNLIYVGDEHVSRLSRHQVHNGDIMVARKGDVRKCVFITDKEEGWMTGSDCLKVALNDEVCFPKFIYYQLRSPFIGKWLETISIGATMPSLNTGLLGGIELFLPPITIQKTISDILSEYDSLIENNQKQIKLLEEAAQRLYKEWFIDLRFPGHESTPIHDGIPAGWEKTTVEGLCSLRKKSLSPDMILPGTPYIGLEHIPRKDFCLSTWGDVSEITSNKYEFRKDDIIFGQIRPYFHKVGFAIVDGVASTDSFVMTPQEQTWGLFLMTVSSEAFVNYAYQTCKEGAKMPRADWNQMKKYQILVANKDIQTGFEGFIKSITRKVSALANQNKHLAEARDRLLPKLMSGEIEV